MPQASVILYVLVIIVGQFPTLLSPNHSTLVALQLSLSSMIKLISGSGIGPVGRRISSGALAVGGVVSFIIKS